MTNITFIGAGNMAASIIGGLIKQGYNAGNIIASDPNQSSLDQLQQQFGIAISTDNLKACEQAKVVVLAVKPQILKLVCETLKPGLTTSPLIISIAAGIGINSLSNWLGNELPIVRCMPNTPALVQQGATGLYANAKVDDEQRQQTQQLLDAVGTTVWLEEEGQIDAVTAISGSAPAYFFLLMEAMIEAGIKQGLSREQAQQLTLQTAAGAATLALNSDVTVDELRRRVTSPGGTTEQAILSFEQANFQGIVEDAMLACAERSQEMAAEFS
ncbi:MAG: pyrroline-5-carboxylate reductase [Cellvibrionaceae bacterium]